MQDMVDVERQAHDALSQAIEAALAAARDALGQGRAAEAEAAYGKALDLAANANRQFPESPRWLYYTGIAMSDMGHPLKAMDALAVALTYDDDVPGVRDLLNRVMSKTIAERLRELRVGDEAGEPRRSVLFFNNLYYNYAVLSAALRRRGWDALTVSFKDPEGDDSFIYFGEELNLYQDSHPALMEKVSSLIDCVPEHFRLFHSMGRWLDHYPTVWCDDDATVLKVKRHGVKFGWNPCGCLEVIRQSRYFEWSGGACLKCNWRTRPDVCSDALTQEFAGRITANADLIAAEDLPAIDFAAGPNCVHLPLVVAIDSQAWSPDLEVPEDLRVPRADGEFLVYHAVGNAPQRTVEASNGWPPLSGPV
jgi:tetratricopeptide (TPR) repeat protein